ncbi:MAG: polyprenyl synthetase family protein, partial [Proteobacteria bacterium]|nr:polyprenyl synthetase family protein [Pseudomonadota bacterium]
HRAFDEKTALLATYALIAEGYDRIRRSASPEVLSDVIEQASKGTGLLGATSGQYLDLNPTSVDEEGLLEVLYLKTGALFELSFVLGWLIGGGDLHLKERVQEAAYHFGLAFQIADDIDDYDQDEGRLYNYARMVGKGRARERVVKELEETEAALEELQIPSLYQLTDLLVF